MLLCMCLCVGVCVSSHWCAHPRARQRHRVCSVIIKSLAGVQRRYEYDCNLSPPMMKRLSHTQMSTCLRQPVEGAHRFKFKRFGPSDHTQSSHVALHLTAFMCHTFFNCTQCSPRQITRQGALHSQRSLVFKALSISQTEVLKFKHV